jgi:hypothetical protein
VIGVAKQSAVGGRTDHGHREVSDSESVAVCPSAADSGSVSGLGTEIE